jgi:hypothetical protein
MLLALLPIYITSFIDSILSELLFASNRDLIISDHRGRKLSAVHPHPTVVPESPDGYENPTVEGGDFRDNVKSH